MENRPTSLVHNMSSSLHYTVPPTYRHYRASKLSPEMAKAYDYYVGGDEYGHGLRAARFLDCKTRANFARHKNTGAVRVLSNSCHLRFCPLCNSVRENMIRRNVLAWLPKQRYPKLLTLTLKSNSLELRSQIELLYEYFKKLRRIKMFKKAVGQGVWFFQITKNQKKHTWHPHLHCLITGLYLPQKKLQKEWQRLTGDSFVVDIRLIKDYVSASCEVARYAASAVNINTLSRDDMRELDYALKNRRICGSWGNARKIKLTTPQKFIPEDWEKIGSWSAVTGMLGTSAEAQAIWLHWQSNSPIRAGVSLSKIDELMKNLDDWPDLNLEIDLDNF